MGPRVGIGGVLVALAFTCLATAEEPGIRGVETAFLGRELRVSARLVPEPPEDVARRLAAGLATTTVWRIALFANRPLWWDGKKGERRYEVTATYRPMSGDWTVERRLDTRLLETDVVPTREAAVAALSRLVALPCFTMGRHLDGKRLVVKVACRYAAGVALGVVPTDVETDWRRSSVFTWREAGP